MSYLKQERLLSSIGGIDAKVIATTNLFTVPAGRSCVITRAVVRVTVADTVTVPPTLGIGIAAGEIDIFPAAALTGVATTSDLWHFNASAMLKAGLATEVIKAGIDVGATATTMTIAIDLFGYLV